MRYLCRASGCGRTTATRFSRYCSAHKSRQRRHGDHAQAGITAADLKPYVARVRCRMEKNQHNPAWDALDARWRAIVEHAEGVIALQLAGRPGSRDERTAAREVSKLGENIPARAVVQTVLAVVMMWEFEPRRFRSDRSFKTQLVRRVRALTDMNYGERYHHPSATVKRYYKDVSPRATAILGQWLVEALGGAGLHVARLERADLEQVESEKRALHKALSELN
ncbi:MAG: hypothetical protein AB7E81_17710 [Hyphomicrobiaceae bacterium]